MRIYCRGDSLLSSRAPERRTPLPFAAPCVLTCIKANRPADGTIAALEAAMRIFDWLTGTKRPAAGVAARSATEVRAALLAINQPTLPFVVRDGAAEKVDLVAEWRIVDAAWQESFAKAGMTKVFKILMRLDADARTVRAVDQEWSVEWRAGVPTLALAAQAFRGQKFEMSGGVSYGFKDKGGFGKVYGYQFSTGEMKTPLQNATTGAGWTWRGVTFGKL
jgi:hypothetical protein